MKTDLLDLGGCLLRVGIVVDSMSPCRWVLQTIKAIQGCGLKLEIHYFYLIKGREDGLQHLPKPKGPISRLYRWLDRRLFCPPWDEMERGEITPFLPPVGIKKIHVADPSSTDAVPKESNLDVAIIFENGIGTVKKVGTILACPVWRFLTNGNDEFSDDTGGFQEVREDVSTTDLSLVEERAEAIPQRLATAVCPTHRYSPWKNRNNILSHAPSLTVQALRRRACSLGPTEQERTKKNVSVALDEEAGPPISLLLARIAKKQFHRMTHRDQWFIGYRQGEPFRPNGGMENFRIAVPPKDRYWADPFPVSVGSRQCIFFEEYLFHEQKAHISCVEVGPRGEWGSPVAVVQRDYHMSYPLLFRFEDALYMLPETGANRTIEVYRCHSFPYVWRFERVIMENIVAADSTIRFIDGLWWMFTSLGSPDRSQFNELWVFYSDHPFGRWRPHRLNPVQFDARFARGAGNLFEWRGAIHRPAQNCSRTYGENIHIRRINELSPRFFQEEEVCSILPIWTKNVERIHTLNWSGDLTVVDGFRWRRKMFDSTC